jgi:lysozyme
VSVNTANPTNIFDQLRRDEGVRTYPYTDTMGKISIGVGRNLTDDGVSPDEINQMLTNDVMNVTAELSRGLPWFAGIGDARQGVLINMAFNMGLAGLLGFHDMLRFMSMGDWNSACTAMDESKWASEVGDRAKRLAEQLLSGEWR